MRRVVVLFLLVAGLGSLSLESQTEMQPVPPFTPDQLDKLLAPIALYPDPLLAQILPAVTFPDQISDAAGFIGANGDPDALPSQGWDPSVLALAHYPPVLQQLADDLDWCIALGQAWINQPDDVMASIQRLRSEAEAVGNLETTPQEEVADDGAGDIEILPAEADFICVPLYDPATVYFGNTGAPIRFSDRFRQGAWLKPNMEWRGRNIVRHGASVREAPPAPRAAEPVIVNSDIVPPVNRTESNSTAVPRSTPDEVRGAAVKSAEVVEPRAPAGMRRSQPVVVAPAPQRQFEPQRPVVIREPAPRVEPARQETARPAPAPTPDSKKR